MILECMHETYGCEICSLVKCKDGLRRMVVDQEWLDWSESTSPAAVNAQDIIYNTTFWADADAIQVALFPIVSVLRLCDSEGSTMGLLYEFMDRLKRAIHDCSVLAPERYYLDSRDSNLSCLSCDMYITCKLNVLMCYNLPCNMLHDVYVACRVTEMLDIFERRWNWFRRAYSFCSAYSPPFVEKRFT